MAHYSLLPTSYSVCSFGASDHSGWQGRYIPVKRRQIGGRLLDRVCTKLNKAVASELRGCSSRTLELDGWDSSSLQQLVNFMLSTFDSEEFLGDRDLTGLGKSAADMTKLVCEVIELVEARYPPLDDTDPVVHGLVTDNPTVMRQIRAQVKAKRKRSGHRLQVYSCWLHAISKILEDIFKIPFFASLLAKHKLLTTKHSSCMHAEVGKAQQMVQFRDQFTDKLGRLQVVTTKRVGATRMGSAYPCMKRNKKLEPVFSFVASLPSFDKKCGISKANSVSFATHFSTKELTDFPECNCSESDESDGADSEGEDDNAEGAAAESESEPRAKSRVGQKKYAEVKHLMSSKVFFNVTESVIDFLRPILRLLRQADMRRSQFSFVWDKMAGLSAIYTSKAANPEGLIPEKELKEVAEIIDSRWEYLHCAGHSFAYCTNPKFHSDNHFGEDGVKKDFEAVVADFYPELQDQSDCAIEYGKYKSKRGEWAHEMAWLQVGKVPVHGWWQLHGAHSKMLQPLVIEISQLRHAAGGCERNWSAHDFLESKRQHSTSSETLNKKVYFYTNSRLRDQRLGRGKQKRQPVYYNSTGDQICYPEYGDDAYDSGVESSDDG